MTAPAQPSAGCQWPPNRQPAPVRRVGPRLLARALTACRGLHSGLCLLQRQLPKNSALLLCSAASLPSAVPFLLTPSHLRATLLHSTASLPAFEFPLGAQLLLPDARPRACRSTSVLSLLPDLHSFSPVVHSQLDSTRLESLASAAQKTHKAISDHLGELASARGTTVARF